MNAITGNKPIPFRRGYPDFSQWAEGTYRFGDLDGRPADFKQVYDAYRKENGLASPRAGQKALSALRLTPHHVHDGMTIELIPRDLHDNIPHLGGAFALRNGGWDD